MGARTGRLIAVTAVAALVAGCNASADATTKTRCDVGGRPDYYVPKPAESPLAIIGCARLGVSGKPVEFSAHSEPIGHKDYACLNPAYRGSGRLGIYIPAACVPDPISRRLAVIGVEIPRQAVRGYRLVIWGTAAAPTRRVVAHHEGGRTRAAVFTVGRPLARAVGVTRPFSVFVVELHPEAACRRVLVRATGMAPPGTTWIRPRPRLCPSA
jgi:hypothetical protein